MHMYACLFQSIVSYSLTSASFGRKMEMHSFKFRFLLIKTSQVFAISWHIFKRIVLGKDQQYLLKCELVFIEVLFANPFLFACNITPLNPFNPFACFKGLNRIRSVQEIIAQIVCLPCNVYYIFCRNVTQKIPQRIQRVRQGP